MLLYAGVNIKQVQGRLGHGDIETTNKYLHVLEEADVEAAKALDIMLLQKPAEKEVPPVVPADKPDSTTTAVTTTRKETIVYEPVVDDTPNEVAPAVTTSAATTTTQKPSDTTSPVEQKPADNGFPSNPSSGDEYVDDKGQTWIYNGIARRWIEGGSTNVETAPDSTPSGNVILS